ncbi:mobile element protein [Caldimonas brevitalea]|uniref:Mobile element protein n=1 Tax=Caldimonas brevitalea TaxID=413882 RepID=A0A0G3BWB9_9BURK|nr:mobile element protein [Caldimonas brevitalea]
MRKSKFTEEQMAYALKQAELGISVEDVCRKMGISSATFYKWRQKYAGVGPSELRRMRQLEEENRKLKQIVNDLPTRSENYIDKDFRTKGGGLNCAESSRASSAAAVEMVSQALTSGGGVRESIKALVQ